MGGLFFILPILAFDVWITLTTGKRQWNKWRNEKNWRAVAVVMAAGIFLAVICAFFVDFTNGTKLRLNGFPVPYRFFSLEDNKWIVTTSPEPLPILERITDFVTGLAAPMIPFKIAEFLRAVKAEIS